MGVMEVIEQLKAEHPEMNASAPAEEGTWAKEAAGDAVDQSDFFSKVLSGAGDVFGEIGNPLRNLLESQKSGALSEALGRSSSILALPSDVMKTYDGVQALRRGDAYGVFDTGIGAAGIVSDVAGVIGNNPVSDTAGLVQGALEINKGGIEIYESFANDDELLRVRGLSDVLDGLADGAGSVSSVPELAAAGKGLGIGLAAGNLIAPLLMGGDDESAEVRQSDGDYVPSTGWCVTDWISGTGKYTDSRWHADGERVTNTPELTEADMENPYVKLALQIAAND